MTLLTVVFFLANQVDWPSMLQQTQFVPGSVSHFSTGVELKIPGHDAILIFFCAPLKQTVLLPVFCHLFQFG